MNKTRHTLTLDPQLVARYQACADKYGHSLSSEINGWLTQVIEAAEHVASVVDQDKRASAQRLRLVVSSLQEAENTVLMAVQKAKGRAIDRRAVADGEGAALIPPSCNTGGKSPSKGRRSAS